MKSIRHFLSDKTVDSYIHVSVYPQEGVQVKLSDCDRAAKIWFNTINKKETKRAIKKLNNIINPLLKLQEYLEKKLEQYERLNETV